MEFPYGKAPLAILIVAICASGVLLWQHFSEAAQEKPTLIFAIFSKDHGEIYKNVLPQFEKDNNCKIQLQVVDQRALQNRLESAMAAGAEVPDMVELLDGTLGLFTKGPLEDVGFIDLTDKLHESVNGQPPLYDQLVTSRFGKWSSRDRIFALPHDVHPVQLCYRADLVKELGINVDELTTWDKFAEVGRRITKESRNKDGVSEHYMIDLPGDGSDVLRLMMIQRGGRLLDKDGEPAFDSDEALEAVLYYVKATTGPDRFSFPAGWGQTLAKAMREGLCLFYVCPDWRTLQFQLDVPDLAGKLRLMNLPAWQEGGTRASTWGGTGLAFPKTCRNFDLAWKLGNYLYYNTQQLGPRFGKMNILPPLKAAWNLPEINEPRPFYGGQAIGKVFVSTADNVPAETITAYINNTRDKFAEAYGDAKDYYEHKGEAGLREYTKADLKRCADQMRVLIHRNVFLRKTDQAKATTRPANAEALAR